MSIKKVLGKTFIFLLLGLFWGCTMQYEQKIEAESIVRVSVNVTGNMRTVLPQDYDSEEYNYKLTGVSSIGGTYSCEITDVNNIVFEATKGIWDFTLEGFDKTDTSYTTPILQAKRSCNLIYKDETISFVLMPVRQGTGNIDITFNWDWEYIKSYKITVLSLKTNNSTEYKDNLTEGTKTLSFAKTDFPAGDYRIQLDLYHDEDQTNQVANTVKYVIVTPTKTSSMTFTVNSGLKKLDESDTPEDLRATVDGNNVTFTWKDNACFEEGFVLKLVWTNDTGITTEGEYSAIQNAHNKTLELDKGEYSATLYAVNILGRTEGCNQDSDGNSCIFTITQSL